MITLGRNQTVSIAVLLVCLSAAACKTKEKVTEAKDLPDINQQIRPFVTVENTKVQSGPGPQFRAIGRIRQDAKVNVVGRDGDYLLIVSKVGNAPGYIQMSSVKPATGKETESAPTVEGAYEATADTYVRSGPSVGHPVLANLKKGTIINVTGEEQGWLKVESKHGKPTGYVDANAARPVETAKGGAR